MCLKREETERNSSFVQEKITIVTIVTDSELNLPLFVEQAGVTPLSGLTYLPL